MSESVSGTQAETLKKFPEDQTMPVLQFRIEIADRGRICVDAPTHGFGKTNSGIRIKCKNRDGSSRASSK